MANLGCVYFYVNTEEITRYGSFDELPPNETGLGYQPGYRCTMVLKGHKRCKCMRSATSRVSVFLAHMNEGFAFPFNDKLFRYIIEQDLKKYDLVFHSYCWCRVDKLGVAIDLANSHLAVDM